MNANYSLRRRLIVWISVPVLLASIVSLLIGFLFSWHEIEEVYDAQMAHSAKLLLQITEYEIIEQKNEELNLGTETDLIRHKYENKIAFRIWYNDRLVTRSWNTDDFSGIEARPGFSDLDVAGKPWRLFVFIDEKQNVKVEVAQRYAIRYELIWQLVISLVAPILVFMPLIFLTVWIGVRKVLKPVVQISADVDKRGSNDLSPIQSDHIPEEIAPLIQAINQLFERIEESFNRERQFTDNAAHELRTPLAAMKTQAQVLLKHADDMPDYKEGLDNLHASIDRAAHMVDQLLSFSRLQSDQIEFQNVDMSALVDDVLKTLSPLAAKQNVDIEADIVAGARVSGNYNALEIMVRNLVNNAIKFTPEGGRIQVHVYPEKQHIVLKISDTGPGIADVEKDNVFQRFYRLHKHKQGSGLGLSIAKWVCDVHAAEITLQDNDPHGLIVTVVQETV